MQHLSSRYEYHPMSFLNIVRLVLLYNFKHCFSFLLQDPLLQKANDLLNTSNPRGLASSSLDGPITANLQGHISRSLIAYQSMI